MKIIQCALDWSSLNILATVEIENTVRANAWILCILFASVQHMKGDGRISACTPTMTSAAVLLRCSWWAAMVKTRASTFAPLYDADGNKADI